MNQFIEKTVTAVPSSERQSYFPELQQKEQCKAKKNNLRVTCEQQEVLFAQRLHSSVKQWQKDGKEGGSRLISLTGEFFM